MKTLIIIAAVLVAGLGFAATNYLSKAPSSAPAVATGDEVDYVDHLPSLADLATGHAPDGSRVSKIVQTSSGIAVTYSNADGKARTVSYRLLSSARDGEAWDALAASTAPTPVENPEAGPARTLPAPPVAPVIVNVSPSNTVVYQPPVYNNVTPVLSDAGQSAPAYYAAAPYYPQPAPDYAYVQPYAYYPAVYSVGFGPGFRGVNRDVEANRGFVRNDVRGESREESRPGIRR